MQTTVCLFIRVSKTIKIFLLIAKVTTSKADDYDSYTPYIHLL